MTQGLSRRCSKHLAIFCCIFCPSHYLYSLFHFASSYIHLHLLSWTFFRLYPISSMVMLAPPTLPLSSVSPRLSYILIFSHLLHIQSVGHLITLLLLLLILVHPLRSISRCRMLDKSLSMTTCALYVRGIRLTEEAHF